MTLRRYRWPAVLLLALHLQACYTWRPSPLSVSQVMAEEPGSIRITTAGGETRTLKEPRLVGDSLTTAEALTICPRDRPEPCSTTHVNGMSVEPTPLDEIASVEVRAFSTWRTVGGIALGAVTTLVLLMLVACDGGDCYPGLPGPSESVDFLPRSHQF